MSVKDRDALKYLALHLFYGTVGGVTFGVLLLVTDLSRIRTLAFESGSPILVLVLLFFGLFITFGSVAMGVGIMSLARDDEEET
jgi:hypothetical protein